MNILLKTKRYVMRHTFDSVSNRERIKGFIHPFFNHFRDTREEGIKVLDIGAGQFAWTKELFSSYKKNEVTSFDQFKTDNIDIVGNLLELDKYVREAEFDLVICSDVMEHCENPFKAIEQMKRALCTGGMLLITCPFKHEMHGTEYGDYWRITEQGWEKLLVDFTNTRIAFCGDDKFPDAYLIRAYKK